MGHTNSTANLSLPQFIGTDKPTWLGDVNGAFSTIDSKVGTIDADISAVDAKADNAVADASNAVTTATNANNTAGTASTTATNALNVANNALTVANNADGHTNQLETKIGLLADLTTTDKTSIVNAINEVNAASAPAASAVSYDNTGSGLAASNVQDAIDELAQGGGGSATPDLVITGDGSKTFGQAIGEIHTFLSNHTLRDNSYIVWNEERILRVSDKNHERFTCTNIEGSDLCTFTWQGDNSTEYLAVGTTVSTTDTNTAIPSGHTIKLYL